jgi:Kip1 ubiquitination-promoting complex protein 1
MDMGSSANNRSSFKLGRKNEREEEKADNLKNSGNAYFEKSKEVGRIGPEISKVDLDSANGTIKCYDENMGRVDIESLSDFSSVRANTAVFKGKFYYEVKLLSSGLMQIGWCTLATPFHTNTGVGDDSTSYAYDGFRVNKWNNGQEAYGEGWGMGDTIGSLIDFEKKEISFYRNNKFLGVAFKNIKTGPNMAYFPALSMGNGERVVFNFGLKPFKAR